MTVPRSTEVLCSAAKTISGHDLAQIVGYIGNACGQPPCCWPFEHECRIFMRLRGVLALFEED